MPVSLDHVKNGGAAVKHSLRKWSGLTKVALKQHGVRRGRFLSKEDVPSDMLVDLRNPDDTEFMDCTTCALCAWYDCQTCPLTDTLGFRCDSDERSPYSLWMWTGNARPMIRALEKTLKRMQKGLHEED